MPRKSSSRSSRQTTRRRRQTNRPQRSTLDTQPRTEVEQNEPVNEPVRETQLSTVEANQNRPVRVPSQAVGALSSEQMNREAHFVRSDLVRLLITMAIVIIFMVIAELILD